MKQYVSEYKIRIKNLISDDSELVVDEKEGYVFPDFLSPRQIKKLKSQGTGSLAAWMNGLGVGEFDFDIIKMEGNDLVAEFIRFYTEVEEDRVKYFMTSSAAQRTDRKEKHDLALLRMGILKVSDKKKAVVYNYRNLLTYGFFLLTFILVIPHFILSLLLLPIERFFGDYNMLFEKRAINQQIAKNRKLE